MDILIRPGCLRGQISVIPSKSQAHRLLICAAFAAGTTQLHCPDTNRDIEATADCLRSLGADIVRTADGYTVTPVAQLPQKAVLNCCESGSTLRFMLPVAGALGVEATFLMEGRLPLRPLSPLWEVMTAKGCHLSRPTQASILCQGKLKPGHYEIDGSVSSQFITGLLLALSLLEEVSTLSVTGKVESRPYIEMTKAAMKLFGVDPNHLGNRKFQSPGRIFVEGDWSNGAFWLAANALGSQLTINGLRSDSLQGDRQVEPLLSQLQTGCPCISAADIPDLIPVLSVVAAAHHGAAFKDIGRLRLKESDRVAAILAMLQALGGKAEAAQDTLTVHPGKFTGGTVDACNDHRIAMSAAIAATVCNKDVRLLGAEAVNKSYPQFWEEYSRLGGNYELYLR